MDIEKYIHDSKQESGKKIFWCQACDHEHFFNEEWTLSDRDSSPTLTPSVLTNFYSYKFKKKMRCHFFMKKGQLQYLNDCNHDMAGKTVSMVKFKLPKIYQ